jgi:serine/threonine protein kinase/tetratricopeptide (TPR) repeat protein
MNPAHAHGNGSAASLADSQAAAVIRILENYLDELEHGHTPHPDELIARHPDLASGLRPHLKQLEVLHRAARRLRDPAPTGNALASSATPTPQRLGDFELVREVARGGMGIVYEAVQLSLRRRVALKVLPWAALDGKPLQRFRNEAQAAAHLHHANIVPVYAVGSEGDVHYYAMEFIEGLTLATLIDRLRQQAGLAPPVSDQCSSLMTGERTMLTAPTNGEAEPLSGDEPAAPRGPVVPAPPGFAFANRGPRDRLFFRTAARLGVQAAEALEHAHQMGVVHRDIKPANLMVDLRGHLWVTDFGLALCHCATSLTHTGDLVGTPRYMSPEQATARRALIDQRTDIYSLGVTLYELLTLEHAVPDGDREEILRFIVLEEPRLPRRVNPAIPPDLETVVLKAMAKNPEERYVTARELADDLRRFLEGEPVRARRPGLAHRARNWARRHRRLVAAGAALLGLAAVCLVVGAWLFWRGQQEAILLRDAARKQVRVALWQREVTEQNLWLAVDALDALLGDTERSVVDSRSQRQVRDLLQAVVNSCEQLMLENEAHPGARFQTARAYRREGNVLLKLGDPTAAAEAYAKAISLLQRLLADGHNLQGYRRELATCYTNLGRAERAVGQTASADQSFRQALTLYQQALATAPDERECRHGLADCFHSWGELLHAKGQPREAAQAFRDALGVLEPLAASFSNDADYRHAQAANFQDLALALEALGQFPQAEKAFCEARDMHERLVADFPGSYQYRYQLAVVGNNLSSLLLRVARRTREAEVLQRQSVALLRKLATDCPNVPNFRAHLAGSYINLSKVLSATDRRLEAEQVQGQATSLLEPLVREFPGVLEYRKNLAALVHNQAADLAETGHFKEAEATYRRALALGEALVRAAPAAADYRQQLVATLNNLAVLLFKQEQFDQALAIVDQGLQQQQDAGTAVLPDPLGQRVFFHLHLLRGNLLLRLGKRGAAVEAAVQLGANYPQSWEGACRAAELIARCGAKAQQDESVLSVARDAEAQVYLEQARGLFQQALQTVGDHPAQQNDLAWFLAKQVSGPLHHSDEAVRLANQAVEQAPDNGAYWNTLGLAYYRSGDWNAAHEALEKSRALHGGDSLDYFFLAMTDWRRGEKDQARQWYARGVADLSVDAAANEEVREFQAETEAVLGLTPSQSRGITGTPPPLKKGAR